MHIACNCTATESLQGTRNTSDHAGWARAIEYWEEIGWENVFVAVEEYVRYLATALTGKVEVGTQAICRCV